MPESSLSLRCSGPLACFTRPELKAERVSYPVLTPSAARGILEAVLWKPAIRWQVQRIQVLSPVRWVAFRRNEVSGRASVTATTVERGGTAPQLLVEDERAQRNTVALRDVDYVIEARFEMTGRAGPGDNPAKFTDMFRRRLAKGQHFHQPYLGCREFVAHIEPVEQNTPPPVAHSQDLGLMLWDIEFSPRGNRPRFFHAVLQDGVLEIPADPDSTLSQQEESP